MRSGCRLILAVLVLWGVMCCGSTVASGLTGVRQFELVSPVYKGGFGVLHIEAVAQDGDGLAFYSPGAFAGAPGGLSENLNSLTYVARRTPVGWSTASLVPPDGLTPYVRDSDVSATLSTSLAMGKPGPNFEAAFQQGTEEKFLLHPTDMPDISTNWELAGRILKTLTEEPLNLIYRGGSADFCHLLLESPAVNAKSGPALLLESAEGTTQQVYELVRGCDRKPVDLRLVALNNEDDPISPSCKVDVGIQVYTNTSESAYNAIAAGGGEILFTTCIKNDPAHHQLFARLDGTKTLEISKPLSEVCDEEVPCNKGKGATERANSDFAGASEDGSRVFFTTAAPLGDEDKGTGNDLYMATIGCPTAGEATCAVASRRVTSLVQVSRESNGGEAGVQGVSRVAPDGSRVYFVATGDLLGDSAQQGLEEEARAVPRSGADNLYSYDVATGQTAFVGDLCSEYHLSGGVEDLRCPSTGVDVGIWQSDQRSEVQTAGADGRFLVFASYAQLGSDDTDTSKDLYRYDAETGALDRISIGEAGHSVDGNNSAFDATIAQGHFGGSVRLQYEMDNRAVSEDGSRIVFTTTEPLSPGAINGLSNAYEWHEGPGEDAGQVSMISGGSAETPVEDVVISPDGGNVFFLTTQGLLPQDLDSAPDVYDARINGGFPQPLASRAPCSSDACQGPLSSATPLLVPGSVSQVSGENVPKPSRSAKSSKPKKSKAVKRKRKSKRASRAGRRGGVARRGRGGR